MAYKDIAKTWFKRGLKPLESQFAQVYEWVRWKDEPVIGAEMVPVIETHSSNFSFSMLSGSELEKIRFKSSSTQNIKLGLTAGADDVVVEAEYSGGIWHTLHVGNFEEAGRTIHFTGIIASTKFYFYKR